MEKIAVISLTGGTAESKALKYKGNQGIRAQILLNDLLNTQRFGGEIIAVCITGMSYLQKAYVDSFMGSHGFTLCCMSPEFNTIRGKYRYTQLSAAYCLDSLNAKNIRYKERTITDLNLRYAAFTIPNRKVKEVRVLHIPCCDSAKPHYDEQRSRKRRLLKMELTLELYEQKKGKAGIISCGDWNTEPKGKGEAQKLFDSLPYEKLLDEPTWNDSKLDNVLISPDLKGSVGAYTSAYRVGITSDHKTVIIEIDD